MEFKNLTNKQKIPVLGLGTWGIGGGMRADYSEDKKYIQAVEYAIQSGLTHIDTAEIYSAGHAEEIVGEAISNFDRKKLFVTTKVSPQHLFLQSQIINSAKKSLARLKTDYIDLYLVHWPNPVVSMKNVMAAFDKLVDEGLVKFIGVSNFSVRQLQNAQKHTKNKIITNQVHYSLLHRDPEKELLPYLQKEKIALTAYSPLAQGRLAYESFEVLDEIAAKYDKTPVQVALAWLIEKPEVITIPKASSKKHIDEIMGAFGWKLTKQDLELLDNEF